MIGQVFILNLADFAQLGKIRAIEGILAAKNGQEIWLSGIPMPENCPEEIRNLPALTRLKQDRENRLYPLNATVPIQNLPDLEWQAIAEFVPLELPTSAFSGETHSTGEIELIPSSIPQSSDLILCKFDDLNSWLQDAPQVRIEQLKYALDEGKDKHRMAFVSGLPLPHIPGKRYYKSGGIYLPSGMKLKHGFLSNFLKSQRDPNDKGKLILLSEQHYEFILDEYFVQLSRSGARKIKTNHG